MNIMAHLIAGYPNKEGFKKALKGLKDGGADILELQIPFSDPTADGPVITRACEEALEKGFKVKEIFDYINEAQAVGFDKIFVMTYANIAFSYAIEKFVKDMKQASITGLIIPDLPIEDEEGFYAICKDTDIIAMPVAVVNTPTERETLIKEKGFKHLYVSLRVGITGQATVINDSVKNFLDKFKECSIYAGFGIRSKEQVDVLKGYIHAAVVGSYFTQIIQESDNIYENVKNAMKKLKIG